MKKLTCLMLLLLLVCTSALAATTIDGGADQAAAVAIAVGESYIDTIDAGKSEWFTFTADQDGAYYRVNLKNEETSAYLNMAIYDEQNVKLYEDDVYTGKSQYYSWKVTPGMKYTIRAWFSDKKASGRATLSINKTPDEHGNKLESASAILLNTEILSTLDGTGDVDVFTFTAAEGSNYYRVDFKNNDLNAYLNYELLDADGLSVQKDDVYTGKSAYISWKAAPGAQYFIKLYSGDKKQCGKYSLTLSSKADNEPNTMTEGVALTEGQKTEGTFDGTGDVDYFTFTTAEGSNYYRVDIKNENLNAYLNYELLDADGLSVQKDDVYTGKSNYISWKAAPGAQYYIKLYSGDKKQCGKYTLTLSSKADNEPNTMTEGVALTEGQKTEGTFDGTGDVDYFTFTTAEGSNYYRIDIKNENLNAYLNYELLDADGLSVQKDDVYTGKSNYISWKAAPGAQYFMKLYSDDKKQCGKYTLTVSHAADNEPDTLETAAALKVGEMSASFDGSKDTDYFTFTAGTQRAYYRLLIKNVTVDSTVYMETQDHLGMKIKTAEAGKGKTGTYNFLGTPGAQYYLKLTRNDTGKIGDYVIVIEEYPDPVGDAATEAQALTAGTAVTEFIGSKEDADYYAIQTNEKGMMMNLTVTHVQGSERMNVAVQDAQGAEVASWRVDAESTTEKIFSLAPSSTYYVRVKSDNVGAYSIGYDEMIDLGGSDIASAAAAQAGETLVLAFEMKADTDYVAFPAAGANLLVMATGDKNVAVTVVDENGMVLKTETYVYASASKLFVAQSKGAYLKLKGDGGEYRINCCTPDAHVSSEYFVSVKDASCSAEGLKEMYCTVCGAVVATQTVEKIAHTPASNWYITKQAGCDDVGEQTKSCTRCGEVVETQEIPATGHVKTHWQITLASTCTENGVQQQVCNACGKLLAQEIIVALGHVEGEWQVKKYPACADSGHQLRACRVCSAVLEEQFAPALGHQYGEWKVVKEPTGSEEGLQQRVCSACGDTQDEIIPKKGFFGGIFGK